MRGHALFLIGGENISPQRIERETTAGGQVGYADTVVHVCAYRARSRRAFTKSDRFQLPTGAGTGILRRWPREISSIGNFSSLEPLGLAPRHPRYLRASRVASRYTVRVTVVPCVCVCMYVLPAACCSVR